MKLWYAIMRNREDDDWGCGSEDFETAKAILEKFAEEVAYIAVIDNGVCVKEIKREEI